VRWQKEEKGKQKKEKEDRRVKYPSFFIKNEKDIYSNIYNYDCNNY